MLKRKTLAGALLLALCALGLYAPIPATATVSSETRSAGPYVGNGVTTSFSFSFKVFEKADLVVTKTSAAGVDSVLTLDVDYSVSLNADQDASPGGSITYPISGSALSASELLTIDSDVARTQGVDLVTGGPFLPNVIENALDRNAILSQQLKRDLDRSIKQPRSDTDAIGDLPTADNRANLYFVFDANGDPSVSSGSGTDTALRTDLASTGVTSGASLVGINDTGSKFTGTTVETALQEAVVTGAVNQSVGGNKTFTGTTTLGTATLGGTTTVSGAITFSSTVNGEAGVLLQGKHTIPILASAMLSRTTNGAASGLTELATNDVMLSSKDFDQTTSEGVQFYLPMPKSWNEGTLTFQHGWTAAAGSGTVTFATACTAFSDDDAMDTAFSGAQSVTDTLIATNDMHITSVTGAVTVQGSPAESDFLICQTTRDIADTLNADARLIWTKAFLTYSAGNDQ